MNKSTNIDTESTSIAAPRAGAILRSLSAVAFVGLLLSNLSSVSRADILFASNSGNNTIEKFTSGAIGSVFANSGLTGPQGLAFDRAANLYAANNGNNTIEKFTTGGIGSVFANSGLQNPFGAAFDSAGNLYAANAFGTIREFSPTGADLGTFAIGGFNLAFDSAGNLYAANQGDNTIERFTPGGIGSVFASSGLNNPHGLAFDSAGNLYAANSGNNTIEKFTSGGVSSVFASTGLSTPEFLAFTNDAGVPLPLCCSSPRCAFAAAFDGHSNLVTKLRLRLVLDKTQAGEGQSWWRRRLCALLRAALARLEPKDRAKASDAEAVRSLIKAENEFANHRLGWMNTINALLFAALSFAWDKDNAPQILTLISRLGFFVSFATLWGVGIAVYSIYHQFDWWEKNKPEGYSGPDVIGSPPKRNVFLRYAGAPQIHYPLVFLIAWIVVIQKVHAHDRNPTLKVPATASSPATTPPGVQAPGPLPR
jgi:hypothetical protein